MNERQECDTMMCTQKSVHIVINPTHGLRHQCSEHYEEWLNWQLTKELTWEYTHA